MQGHQRKSLRDISIVVPIHNDRAQLKALFAALGPYPEFEIIVADAKSSDDPQSLNFDGTYCVSPTVGRGHQIHFGVEQSTRDWIWILHADTVLSREAIVSLARAVGCCSWGSFNVKINHRHWLYRVIETMMNLRSRLSGISTGDQGIFVKRELLATIGGVPSIPLMEDIELCKRLKRLVRPYRVCTTIGTSPRKWEREGIVKTIVRMWCFRLRFFLGQSPTQLYRQYYS